MKKILLTCSFYALVLFLWFLIAQTGLWPPYILPSPQSVLSKLVLHASNGTLLLACWISLRRILIGYLVSIAAGILVGLFLGSNYYLDETIGSFLSALQTIPSICWLPLSILWLGLSENAIVFIVIMGAFFSITTSTRCGVKSIPEIFLRAGKNMGARGWKLLREIIFPASFPSILAGLRQGWSFAWRALLAAELIFVNLGLGHLLMMGRELNDMSQVIAIMIVLMFIGLFVDKFCFEKIERQIARKWGFNGR